MVSPANWLQHPDHSTIETHNISLETNQQTSLHVIHCRTFFFELLIRNPVLSEWIEDWGKYRFLGHSGSRLTRTDLSIFIGLLPYSSLQTGEEQPLDAVCCEDHVVRRFWRGVHWVFVVHPRLCPLLALQNLVLGFLTALAWARMRRRLVCIRQPIRIASCATQNNTTTNSAGGDNRSS